MTGADTAPALEVRGLQKRFGSTHALAQMDLELAAGEIHGLIGPNGAGKSTFVKILAGVVQPDAGEIRIGGEVVRISAPQVALANGLSFVHQQMLVAPMLSVLDNIFVGLDMPTRFGRVDKPAMRRLLEPVLTRLQIRLRLDDPIETLSVTEQRFAMVARALLGGARGIAFDEPTASLERAEVKSLFQVLRQLRTQGVAILFISHRLGEVLELCDRVTVLRDGRTQGTNAAAKLSHRDLLHRMGADEDPRSVTTDSTGSPVPKPSKSEAQPEPLLIVRGITGRRLPHPISFTLQAGEIIGLAGVVGSGRSQLAKTLAGLTPRMTGEVTVGGRRLRGRHLRPNRESRLVLLPDDRARNGVSLTMTVRENVTLGVLDRVYRRSPFGIRRRALDRSIVAESLARVGLDPRRADAETSSFSGGMQQRVLFAKTLACRAQVLVLDEPTQGVDVGTKLSLHQLIREIAAEGRGLIVISSELEELVALCDRVICMHEGRLTRELQAPDLTASKITRAIWDQQDPTEEG